MKALLGLMSAAAFLVTLGGAASAQTTSSNRACKRGEQMVGGVCKPTTRSGTPLHGQYKGSPRSTSSTSSTSRTHH